MKKTLIEQLRAAEQGKQAKQIGNYTTLVHAIASGGDTLPVEKLQRILDDAGRTPDDLDRHVEMARRIGQIAANVEHAKSADYQAQLLAATKERSALLEEKESYLKEHKAREATLQGEIHTIRLSEAATKRDIAELSKRKRCLETELNGGEVLPEQVPAPPKFKVQQHAKPNGAMRPRGYDAYSQDWECRSSAKGVVSYWHKGIKVS